VLLYRFRTESIQMGNQAKSDAITLATVAEALGVSRTTVSNAYNRPDQLSPELRQRVLAAARELGYHGPDPLARTLRRGTTGAVGVIFDEPLSYAFADPAAVLFLQGIAAACEQVNASVLVVPRSPASDGRELIRNALVDGFIAECDAEGDERIGVLAERGLPFVMVDAPVHPAAAWVGIDDQGTARAAAEHLLGLGHRRFGVVALPLSPDGVEGRATLARQESARYGVSRDRLAGYRAALEAAGIEWLQVSVEEHWPNGFDSGAQAAAALLDQAPRPTAVLAMSDELALGVLHAAGERGIDVPADLSIVGFDDTPGAGRAQPPLTTVRQPHQEKGEVAARLLLEGAPADARVELTAKLVVRASSGPAPT
jgi:DNA-binding LacI/PurR family transcriptional regulator